MCWKLGPQEATVDNGNFPRWNLVKSSYTSVGVVVLKGIMGLQSKLYCCVISHPPPGTHLPWYGPPSDSQQRWNQWGCLIFSLMHPSHLQNETLLFEKTKTKQKLPWEFCWSNNKDQKGFHSETVCVACGWHAWQPDPPRQIQPVPFLQPHVCSFLRLSSFGLSYNLFIPARFLSFLSSFFIPPYLFKSTCLISAYIMTEGSIYLSQ